MSFRKILMVLSVFSAVLAMFCVSGSSVYSAPPHYSIALVGVDYPYADNVRMTGLTLMGGGIHPFPEDLEVRFNAALGGRDNAVENVSGVIENLGTSPQISWDNSPTVTDVELVSSQGGMHVGKKWESGEYWTMVFSVDNSSFPIDITRLSVIDLAMDLQAFYIEEDSLPGLPKPDFSDVNENELNPKNYYSLSAFSSPSDGGAVSFSSSGGFYKKGKEITLKAEPKKGYKFENWSGDVSEESNKTTVVMDSNKTVTAHFSKKLEKPNHWSLFLIWLGILILLIVIGFFLVRKYR